MNFTQLDTFFNTVFAAQSKAPKNYGKQTIGTDITLEGTFKGGVYTLTCTISGLGISTRRAKSSGVNAPVEIPWDMEAVNAYYLGKMDSLFSALPAETQASFAAEYVAVKDFVKRGRTDVAKQIIASTSVTSDLTRTKNALLALL